MFWAKRNILREVLKVISCQIGNIIRQIVQNCTGNFVSKSVIYLVQLISCQIGKILRQIVQVFSCQIGNTLRQIVQ